MNGTTQLLMVTSIPQNPIHTSSKWSYYHEKPCPYFLDASAYKGPIIQSYTSLQLANIIQLSKLSLINEMCSPLLI